MRLNSFILDSDFLLGLFPASVLESLNSYAYLGNLNLDRMVLPFLFMATILIVLLVSAKKRWRYRSIVYFFGTIVFVRLMLFGNPISWFLYYKYLDWQDVGFRQVNVINTELRHYFDPPDLVNYLAVGSSQTGAIYSDHAKENADFYKVELSGMGPTEYYLYREILPVVNPKYVLLYLSEFDLARKPSYDTYRYAPKQWLSLPSYSRWLYEMEPTSAMRNALKEMWIAQFFPEFKYSFIFKGFVKKLLGTNPAYGSGAKDFEASSTEDKLKDQVESLKDIFDKSAIDDSIDSLKYFFDYCENRELTLVILEGEYHPFAMNEKNKELKNLVRDKLVGAADQYRYVHYLGSENFPDIHARDFVDGYHIGSEAGHRFSKVFTNYIEKNVSTR